MLTPAQKTTLKADILANFPNSNDQQIADAYNLAASPDFWVWKTRLTKSEIVSQTSQDGTTFNWSGWIARTVQEQAAWIEIFNHEQAINPSLANVRQAFADIFSGAQAIPVAMRAHLLNMARRKATRAEKLFATGTGSTASPATMGFEGVLTVQDVVDALNS